MGFDWHFGADDQLSDKAERMARALEKLEATTQRLVKSMEGMDEKQQKAARSHESLATTLHSTIEVGIRVAEVFERIGEGVYEVGKSFVETALHAASFKETALVGLSTMLGSDNAAEGVLNTVVGLASKLPIQTGEAMSAATNFLMAGYKQEDIVPLVTAMADIKALNGERGAFSQEMFLRQLREIRSVGLNSRHLMALSNETSLPEDAILGKLSGMYGWGKIDPEEAKKHLGEVNKEDAIVAILQVLADKQGGQIGNLSNKLSQTVEGLESTLKSRKLELFMDLEKSEGYEKFKGFLSNLAKLTEPGSPFSTRMKAGIERTFNGLFDVAFGDLTGANGLGNMENLLDRVLTAAEGFADGFGDAMRGLLDDGNSVFKTGPLSKDELERIKSSMKDFGRDVGAALRTVVATIEDIGTSAKHSWGYLQLLRHPFDDAKAHEVLETYFKDVQGKGFATLGNGDGKGGGQGAGLLEHPEYVYHPAPLQTPAVLAKQQPTITIGSIAVDAKGSANPEEVERRTKQATHDAVMEVFEQIAQQTGGLTI